MTVIVPHARKLPVIVVTGFLGSGKTTLLRHMLRAPEFADTAVIINEFGETGLDHVLVETSEDNVLLLENGCLCCGLRSDLVSTLLDLLSRRERGEVPAFRRVVVETSGLADPVPLLQTFISDPLRLSLFEPGGVVTCLDAVNGSASIDRHRNAGRQLALADTIVITKGDLASSSDAMDQARRRNRSARIVEARMGRADPRNVLGQPVATNLHAMPCGDGHGSIVSVTWKNIRPLTWPEVESAVGSLVGRHGDRLLRLKGLLDVEGAAGPVSIDGVQHLFHRPRVLEAWPGNVTSPVLVAIAEETTRQELETWLRQACSSPA